MNNMTDVGIRFTNKVYQENKLKKLAENLNLVREALNGINKDDLVTISKSSDSIKNFNKNVKETNNSKNKLFDVNPVTKFTKSIHTLTKAVRGMYEYISSSADYLENVNLFQVAFNGNYKSAEKFVNKLSEMYGLDESWLVRTVGIFRQLANAMNLSTETGERLSELMTQMSLDISSLYNVDMERASSVLQSALAG